MTPIAKYLPHSKLALADKKGKKEKTLKYEKEALVQCASVASLVQFCSAGRGGYAMYASPRVAQQLQSQPSVTRPNPALLPR